MGNELIFDVPSIVVDLGSHTLNAGYSGDDAPRLSFSSRLAKEQISNNQNNDISNYELKVGPGEFIRPKNNTEIINVFDPSTCQISDFEGVDKLFEHVFKLLTTNNDEFSSEYPVLMTEYEWNEPNKREKLSEILFEKYNLPGFYLAKNSVLAAFGMGRSTAVVLHSGALNTSVSCVHEGYVLKKREFISEYILNDLFNGLGYNPMPYLLFEKKETLEPNEIPKQSAAKLKSEYNNITKSYFKHLQLSELRDFKEGICQVFETRYNENYILNRPQKPYEFYDGYNRHFGIERFRYPEIMFQPNLFINRTAAHIQTPDLHGLPNMIMASVNCAETEIRPHMLSNIIVEGGNTWYTGFNERLIYELSNLTYGLVSNNSSFERRSLNWLGGSILASLGSFHQLWFTKDEYKEHGASLINKKCA